MSFIGFKDGKTYVNDEHIEAVSIGNANDQWTVDVFLRYPDGSRQAYPIYECTNELAAKDCLNAFLSHLDSVITIN